MILTSNQIFDPCGDVLGSASSSSASLDRVLHHSITVNIKGDTTAWGRSQPGLLKAKDGLEGTTPAD